MADTTTGTASGVIGSDPVNLNVNLSTSSDDSNIEGVTEANTGYEELFAQWTGIFRDMLTAITGINENQTKFQEDNKKSLRKTKDKADEASGQIAGPGKDSGGINTSKTKVSDLNKLDAAYGLGFVVIANKLDAILGKLGDGKKKEDEDNSGGKGLGRLAKQLAGAGQAVLMMVAGFMGFVGAMALASSVAISPKALFTLAMYEMFIALNIGIANMIESENAEKKFKEMGMSVLMLVAALVAFDVAIMLCALTAPFVLKALPALTLFAGFVLGAVFLAKLLDGAKQDFFKFALSSLILTAAIVTFSIALIVAASTSKYVLKAIPVMLSFIVFMGIAVALGVVAGYASMGLAVFAAASVALSLALLTFSVAIKVAAKVKMSELKYAGRTIIMSTELFIAASIAGLAATVAILGIGQLVVVSTLLLPVFGALFLIGKLSKTIKSEDITTATKVISQTVPLFLAASVAGLASAIAIVPIGFLLVASTALMGSVLAINKIVNTLRNFNPLEEGKVDQFFDTFNSIVWKTIGLSFKLMLLNMKSFNKIATVAEGIHSITTNIGIALANINKLGMDDEMISLTFGGFFTNLNTIFNAIGDVTVSSKLRKHIKEINEVTGNVLGTVRAVTSVMSDAQFLANMSEKEYNQVTGAIEKAFANIKSLITDMTAQAKKLDSDSRKSLKVISEAVLPITQSVESLFNVYKIAYEMKNNGFEDKMFEDLSVTIANGMSHLNSIALSFSGKFPKIKSSTAESIDAFANAISPLESAITNVSSIAATLNAGSFEDFSGKTESLLDGVKNLNPVIKAINKVSEVDSMAIENINALTEAFNKLAKVGDLATATVAVSKMSEIGQAKFTNIDLKPYSNLAEVANNFAKIDATPINIIAEAFERMAQTADKIAVMADAVSNLSAAVKSLDVSKLNKLQDIGLNMSAGDELSGLSDDEQAAKSRADQETPEEKLITTIANTLTKWDKEGVPTIEGPKKKRFLFF